MQISDITIKKYSKKFLGLPYVVRPNGEGASGEFDRRPLIRFDGFDCLTYVNTVMALALANGDEQQAESYIKKLNYYDADPKYLKRFHFMSADWNPENQRQGFIQDITAEMIPNEAHHRSAPNNLAKIQNEARHRSAHAVSAKDLEQNEDLIRERSKRQTIRLAKTTINRPNWLLHRTLDDIYLGKNTSDSEKTLALENLKSQSNKLTNTTAATPYIPITDILDKENFQNFCAALPEVSIMQIVRPNWNLRDKIGTNINISHLGFLIKQNNAVMFRHASSDEGKVVEILLKDYLEFCQTLPSVEGVGVFKFN